MKSTFRFDPELWLSNRALRACSPAARGFWADLLALMHPSGYLVMPNGNPMSEDQIATLVGAPVRLVRGWIKELGENGIFAISADNKLCSSRMVKEAEFAARAKVAGTKGQAKKKEIAARSPAEILTDHVATHGPGAAAIAKVDRTHTTEVHGKQTTAAPAKPPAPAKKALDWWKSPAGWVRMGSQQAMSMLTDEAFEDFQIRLAARIPPGRHLDVLTPGQMAAVAERRPKDPQAAKEQPA